IQDLAANSDFEEVIYLLIHGELPTAAQLEEIKSTMARRRDLPADMPSSPFVLVLSAISVFLSSSKS
ncbi:MAG TPA: citrate/2-methylcitrate synthase, partial [Chloroflexia bacterium]